MILSLDLLLTMTSFPDGQSWAMKQNELSLFAFVVPFFVVSLSQQVLETRSLLSRGPAKPPVKSSEVTP